MKQTASETAYNLLTAEDDGRVCLDIPDSACKDQPQNFFKHVGSLGFTKLADMLIDPKLILSWLLTSAGTPAFFIGLLVPLREAGALLPQLFTAGYIRSMAFRKHAWAIGSLIQGMCAALIGIAALSMEGIELGVSVVVLVALLALARSVCSVSYKDVLGKTVAKSKRGTATGLASSVAASLIILYAIVMSLDIFDKTTLILTGLFFASGFWIFASALFVTLTEEAGSTEGGGNPITVVRENFSDLISDKELQNFILARALLISTALAPPFMVALFTQKMDDIYGGLGFMVLASATATLISSYVWGRMADRSSRKVLMLSGLSGGIALSLSVIASMQGWTTNLWVMPILLFGLMIAYQGVRLGRATHLVDMATQDKRATYTAFSNTIIGVLLIVAGGMSLIAQVYGVETLLALFALMSFGSVLFAARLKEAQQTN